MVQKSRSEKCQNLLPVYDETSGQGAGLVHRTQSGITVISDALQLRCSEEQAPQRQSQAFGIGFEEARELFSKPYWLDRRSDVPEQYLAVGWVGGRLHSVILEFRADEEGEIWRLVTLWRSGKEEIRIYEENS
jgi:uncharacterized DUF497 family protein